METNDLYVGVMYAKKKNICKIIRMFLVTPIKEYNIFSSKPIIKGFKEAITDTVLIKGLSEKDINDKNIIWKISNKKASFLIPKNEIEKYINISKEDMNKLLIDSKEEAESMINSYTKIKTK